MSISPNIWFAGQNYNNVTISGTGFNPTASKSCAESGINVTMSNGGTLTSKVTAVTATQITATVMPAAADSTGGATVAISGAQAPSPNADVLEIPVITWASDPDGSNPTISGPNAKLPNPSAVIGQQILLSTTPSEKTLEALPVYLTLMNSTWVVEGTNIGGYTPTTGPTAPTATVLTNPGLTTYWVYSDSSASLTYSYCVAPSILEIYDEQCSPDPATAAFNVTGPTGGTMSFTPFAPAVTIANLTTCIDPSGATWPGGPWMAYATGETGLACPGEANYPAVGINFNNPAGYANGSEGSYSLVQLISSDTTTGESSNTKVAGLDTSYPYGGPPTSDSPKVYLQPTATSVTRTFSANMFLMWTSSTANAIPVPLGYQTWGFSGTATCSTSCGTAVNWNATTNGPPGPVGGFVPSSASQIQVGNNTLVDGYPTWTGTSQ
jgi:hypothetical protein